MLDAPPALDDRPLVLESIDRDHIVARLDGVVLVVWAGEITTLALQGLATGLAAAAADHPEGITMLGVTLPEAPVTMHRTVRAELSALLDRYAAHLRGIGVLDTGAGISRWLRGGMWSSVSMEARGLNFHEPVDLEAAVEWGARVSGERGPSPMRLGDALDELNARVRECRNPTCVRAERSTLMLTPPM